MAPASSAMSTSSRNAGSGTSMPVGLCGVFTTMSFVRGVTAALTRAGSSTQPSDSCSSMRVTSAPSDRATSWSDWYAGQTTTAWSPAWSRTLTSAKIPSEAPEKTRTSSPVRRSNSCCAIASRSSGCPIDSV